MAYLDAFVTPVRRTREADYLALARLAHQVWLDHGALAYVEARAEDAPMGKLTSFPRAVLLEPDEVAYVAFITYRDRAHRDAVNAKVMGDPRFANFDPNGPADMKRLIFGGFETVTP